MNDVVSTPPRDAQLELVYQWWFQRTRADSQIGDLLRRAFDEVLDGQRTGRWMYEDLSSTEKSYVGTKVEILLRECFDIPRGPSPKRLDFEIGGIGVDCKYTQDRSWMIPTEAVNELCLLITASDATSTFSLGLLRCHELYLGAPNRDQKRGILSVGREAVTWLWRDAAIPPNLLRRLPTPTIEAIFTQLGRGNGQARVNELFRRVHGQIVRREVTLTVAQQDDGMKRARDARRHLRPEGIVILGHHREHSRIARDLGLPIPQKGELVAIRLVPATPQRLSEHRAFTIIGTETWVGAMAGDPIEPGPPIY